MAFKFGSFSNRTRGLALFSGLVIFLLGFQNCSPVNFSDVPSVEGAKAICTGDDCDDDDNTPTPQIPDTLPPDATNDYDPTDNDAAYGTCLEAIANSDQAVTLGHRSKIMHHRGDIFAKVSHLRKVMHSQADLMIFVGNGPGARLDKIMHHRGNILLCGLDVKKIMHVRSGQIVAVDVNIGKVMHNRGDILVERGTIDKLKHNSGSVNFQ